MKIEKLQLEKPFPVFKNTYDHSSLCYVELGVHEYIQEWFPKVIYRTQSREKYYHELFLTTQD